LINEKHTFENIFFTNILPLIQFIWRFRKKNSNYMSFYKTNIALRIFFSKLPLINNTVCINNFLLNSRNLSFPSHLSVQSHFLFFKQYIYLRIYSQEYSNDLRLLDSNWRTSDFNLYIVYTCIFKTKQNIGVFSMKN